MSVPVQSVQGQSILSALITVFQNHDGQVTLERACQEVPMIAGNGITDDDVAAVLSAYTSETIACTPQDGQIACVFQDLGDGVYELIADDETLRALKGEAGSLVDPNLVAPVPKTRPKISREQADQAVVINNNNYDGDSGSGNYVANAALSRKDAREENLAAGAASIMAEAADKARKAAQAGKIDGEIELAEEKIRDEKRKIADHEEQISRDSTNLMKSLHKMEIRHDENVIDRHKKRIAELRDENE